MADMLKVCKQLPGNSEDDGSRPLNKRVAEKWRDPSFFGGDPIYRGPGHRIVSGLGRNVRYDPVISEYCPDLPRHHCPDGQPSPVP